MNGMIHHNILGWLEVKDQTSDNWICRNNLGITFWMSKDNKVIPKKLLKTKIGAILWPTLE